MSEAFFRRLTGGVTFSQEMFARRASRVLQANVVLANAGEPTMQLLDANGAARNVNLPLETANDGKMLLISNIAAGAFALTLQSNAGAALTPAVSVAQNKSVLMFCDGTVWRALLSA